MRQTIIILLLFIITIDCKAQPIKILEETIYELKSPDLNNCLERYNFIANEVELIYNQDTTKIELYLQIEENGLISRVKNFDNVPEDFYASYNVIRSKIGKIIYISEYPHSGSGDWDLGYENYFDEKGNLIAFIRKCGFFNGVCAEIIHEKSEYFYNLKHVLVKKTYEITDENKKPLNYKNCIFNYRYDYKQYLTLEDYLEKNKFTNNGL